MLPYLSDPSSRYHNDINDYNYVQPSHSSFTHPTDTQELAKRAKRRFHVDPGLMPPMDMVLSEDDWRQKKTDSSLPRRSSAHEMRARRKASAAECSRLETRVQGDRERAISDRLRRTHSQDPLAGAVPWSKSLRDSPIYLQDTIGSPLQESINAHAETDDSFLPPPLNSRASSSTTKPVKCANERYRGGMLGPEDTQAGVSGSLDSTMTPSLCTDGSRSTMRRHSLGSSFNNTPIELSSLQSNPAESDLDGLADECIPHLNSAKSHRGYTHHDYPSIEGVAQTASSSSLPFPRHRHPSYPIDELDLGNEWFARRRPTERLELGDDSERPSLIPSFYSEGSGPSGARSQICLASRVASAVRHRYVAISYKVRLAIFRTEKRLGASGRRR